MKTWLKTVRLLALCLLPLVLLPTAKAQIPVTDGGAIANQIVQIQNMVQQFQQMQTQYQQMQATHNSLNGLRGISSLLSNDLLTRSLPFDFQQYTSIINGSGGNAAVNAALQNIISQNQTTSCAAAYASSISLQQACEKRWKATALQQLSAQNILNQSATRMNNMGSMLNTILGAPDAKSIADFKARLDLEQIKTSTERAQLDMIKKVADADTQMKYEQQKQDISTGAFKEFKRAP